MRSNGPLEPSQTKCGNISQPEACKTDIPSLLTVCVHHSVNLRSFIFLACYLLDFFFRRANGHLFSKINRKYYLLQRTKILCLARCHLLCKH